MTKFQVYAPLQKTLDDSTGDDGTLTITGVASTTNQDLTGDIIQQSAIQSMKEQALTKNLHLDHHYGLADGIIGTINEVLDTDEDTLSIKAVILPKYASEIKEMLDIGINLGLSIGGYVTEYTPQKDGGWIIEGFDLMEISLTGMPANWDTFGTITTSKGLVKSKCLTGACIQTIKNMENKNMAEENNDTGLTEESVKEIAANLFNELMAEKQEEIVQSTVDMVKDQLEAIVEDKIDDDNNDGDDGEPSTEPTGENNDSKACGDDDEETKSISVAVAKAVAEQMGVFFEQVEKNRNPQPKIDQTEVETKSNDGTYSIEEIAKALGETNTSNIIADAMNRL